MAHNQRGLSEKHEQDQLQIIRDTRTVGRRFKDFIQTPIGAALVLCICTAVVFVLSYFSELMLIFGTCIFIYACTRKIRLPFRMPQYLKVKDHNDLHPATGKPKTGSGIYFFGNEKESQDELWFNNDDMRTHVLIFGSTGSGKTETLISLAYNALVQASGFIYVDGKGDNSLFAKLFSMVRSMGREDDMLLINFMTGARDITGPQETRLSNTINPFATGSSSMLSQLVISLMDSAAGSSDGDMWKGRAMGFVEAIMRVLVTMRDAGYILLDANSVRNYFLLPRLEAMVIDKVFIRDGQESISLANLPPSILEPINNYVLNLPGYNREKKGQQVSQVLEQHGFITMQLTRVFTSLADTYGHILRTRLGEVDLRDVVLNRRILCVLLPALEKSPEELSNLGKVIIASLKVMMAAGLGDAVEGSFADIVQSKPTNSETPYLCILDEYGYYAVEGFAVVPAQARSLGFSVVFAGQDLPAFQKASKEEAASIGANCNIKICMKLEDPTETWDFFMKSAGESYVTHVESFQVDAGSLLGNYQDGKSARLEKRSRIDLLDLKEQNPGEAHLLFKSKIVRYKTFYASPPPVKRMRLNHFLVIDGPLDRDVENLRKGFEKFEGIASEDSVVIAPEVAAEEEIDRIAELLHRDENTILIPVDRSLAAFKRFCHGEEGAPVTMNLDFADQSDEEAPAFFEEPVFELELDYLDVFTPLAFNDHLRDLAISKDQEAFKKPILPRSNVRDQIEYLQRLCGKNSQQAMSIAIEIVADMERGTHYPPEAKGNVTALELAQKTHQLIENITLKKQAAVDAALE